MATERSVLITGATGSQGGAVARALVGKGFKLRGMTRKPDGDAAKALAKLGIEIVKGDLDDEASLKSALGGTWGVFAVQNTWEAGVEKEEEQGKRVARTAKAAGVQHFVYTSVGSANLKTGIPHFDNKSRVEDVVRSVAFPSHVIIRPVFFMENLLGPWFLNGDTLATGLSPETKLQMVAVEDIGRVGAHAFVHGAEMNRVEVDIAGDAVTMPHAADVIGRAKGKKLNFFRVPIEDVRKNSADFAAMLEWFDRVGYSVNIPELEKQVGAMTRFDAWVAKNVHP